MRNVLPVLFLFVPAFIFTPATEGAVGAVYGGEVHLQGAVMESACLVMLDMDDLAVDMGHYNTGQFRMVGDYIDSAVSFAIKIRQCSRGVANNIILKLNGVPDKSDPDVFSVSHREDYSLSKNSEYKEDHTGLGLAIFERNGRQIVPGGSAAFFSGKLPGLVDTLEFEAKYRVTSPVLIAGALESVVWLGVAYF